jgi:membrane protease YdiL (CAAX protease family)
MENVWIYLPFLIPVIVANLGERHRHLPYVVRNPRTNVLLDLALRYGPYGLILVINLGLLGLAGLALLNELVRLLMPESLDPQTANVQWLGLAFASFFTALAASPVLIPAVRRWLARWLPIAPDSLVHTTALAFAIYQIGLSLGLMTLIGDLENLITAEMALTITDVVVTSIPFIVFALAGVGLFIRRGGRRTVERLGLFRPTWKQLLAAVGITLLLLAFNFGVNLAWEAADPQSFDLMERVTNHIFGNLATVAGAIALGLSAGIGEELLFRGAVQPRLGLLLTAVLFTIGHLQYGMTIATIEILIIGLVLGLVRNRANTSVCILIHVGYNTGGTLLEML